MGTDLLPIEIEAIEGMTRDQVDPVRGSLGEQAPTEVREPISSDIEHLCVLAERLGFDAGLDVENLDVDHLRAVLDLPFDAQARLLSEAVSQGWSVRRLRAEVAAETGAIDPSTPPRRIQVPPRNELVELYIDQQLAISAVADRYGVTGPTAKKWLTEAGVELRSRAEQIRLSKARLAGAAADKDLSALANEEAITEAGAGVPPAAPAPPAAHRKQPDHADAATDGAARRRGRGRARQAPPRDELHQRYVGEELSLDSLAAHYEVSRPVATRWLREAGIEVRGRGARRRTDSVGSSETAAVSETADGSDLAPTLPHVDDVPLDGQQLDEREPETTEASQDALGRLANVVDGEAAGEVEDAAEEGSGEPEEASEPAKAAPHPLAKPAPPREDLEALYLTQGFAVNAVAKHFQTTPPVVRRWLAELGIRQRTRSEQARLSASRGPRSSGSDTSTLAATAGPPKPVDLKRSVRVRRRDEDAPERHLPQYEVDERDRVVRVDQGEEPEPEPRRRPERERPQVQVLDLRDEALKGRPTLATTAPRIRQVDLRRMPVAAPFSPSPTARPAAIETTPSTSLNLSAPGQRVPMPTRTSPSPGDERDELVALHLDKGFSVPEIALRLGKSVTAVRGALLTAGNGWCRSWRDRFPPGQGIPPRERLAALLELGIDVNELAESYDVSVARVRAWLDKYMLVPETGVHVEKFVKLGAQQAAIVRIPDGARPHSRRRRGHRGRRRRDRDGGVRVAAWC